VIYWAVNKVICHQTFVACNAISKDDFLVDGLNHPGDWLCYCHQEEANQILFSEIPDEMFKVEGIGIHCVSC
jgi:hypothetical protein